VVHIDDWHEVEHLMHDREDIKHCITQITRIGNASLGVTINGRYMDAEIVDTARRAVVVALEHRLSEMDARLRQLGLDVPALVPTVIQTPNASPEVLQQLYKLP
jgi:hypothetical protein